MQIQPIDTIASVDGIDLQLVVIMEIEGSVLDIF